MSFGDGSDGDVIISSNTTLTSNMNYSNLTVNAGVTLYPDGYVIYVKNTLTLDGTINRNGNNGGLVTGGAGLPTRSVGGSGSGGRGYYNDCDNGENVNGIANSIGGGTYHGCVGGVTDEYTELTADNVGELITNASNMKGGPGGGGGGAWSYTRNGAGGGSGGGVIYIEAQSIHISSAGLITAAGGNHYEVWAANSFSGGGGGGSLVLLYDNITNDGMLSVAAGSHTTHEDTTPWATSGNIYLIYSTFIVTSITPDTNKNSVVTNVEIIGTEFVDGCTVTIGTTDLTNVNIKNDTTITATIPARISAGTYDITVTKPDASTATLTNGFIVTEILDIASISPVSGYNHVDTNVTIYGSGFIDGCTVMINGTSLTNVVFISSFEVTATVPSGINKGDKDVKLINPDTSNITLTNGFLVKIRVITIAPTNKGSRLRSRILYNIVN